MLIVTGKEMGSLEQAAQERLGFPALLLMENAGSRVVEALERIYGPLQGKRAHILAGPGNNGGDGLVVARQLLAKGARPRVNLIGDQKKLTAQNRTNLEILKKLGLQVQPLEEVQIAKEKFSLGLADLIIDAILGTGFTGQLRENLLKLASVVNEIPRPVVSIDVPTGVDASTGKVGNTAIRADYTINLGLPKVGCFLYPGKEYAGHNVIADLGMPLLQENTINRFLSNEETLGLKPPRQPWGHKGTFGHVLVVGGSLQMAGAPSLSGRAALRGGAGLVTLAVPEGTYSRFPADELMITPLPQTEGGALGKASLPRLLPLFSKKDALVLGPGLSQGPQVASVVAEVLQKWAGPAVIDADALAFLSQGFLESVPSEKRKKWVLTPHPGEMGRMLGKAAQEVNENRLAWGREFAEKWGVTLVLKGAPTIISSPQKTYINTTGNHALATGGTGDILAGLLAAFLAQGLNGLDAARLAVYVHGLAGDLAAGTGGRGLIASDCLPKIQQILE